MTFLAIPEIGRSEPEQKWTQCERVYYRHANVSITQAQQSELSAENVPTRNNDGGGCRRRHPTVLKQQYNILIL